MLYCTAQYTDFAGVLRLQSRGQAQVFVTHRLARALGCEIHGDDAF